MCQAISERIKDMTRRLVKENQKVELFPDGAIKKVLQKDKEGKWRTKWIVGKDYAVQSGRGHLGIARIVITEIRKERLFKITEDGAKREGFESRNAFLTYFYELYKQPIFENMWNPEIWILKFKVVE